MDTDPVPAYFSFRYVLWMIWANSITILSVIQGAFASFLLIADDPTNPMLSHNTVRWIVLLNAVLTYIVARVKKNNPPSPPPSK